MINRMRTGDRRGYPSPCRIFCHFPFDANVKESRMRVSFNRPVAYLGILLVFLLGFTRAALAVEPLVDTAWVIAN